MPVLKIDGKQHTFEKMGDFDNDWDGVYVTEDFGAVGSEFS